MGKYPDFLVLRNERISQSIFMRYTYDYIWLYPKASTSQHTSLLFSYRYTNMPKKPNARLRESRLLAPSDGGGRVHAT